MEGGHSRDYFPPERTCPGVDGAGIGQECGGQPLRQPPRAQFFYSGSWSQRAPT